jgi:AcrR family transcriptional regulator
MTRNVFLVNKSQDEIMDANQRRLLILQAAARLIAHYGFDKTTMEDIARGSGVSKGALYLCWSSKDELFDALLAHEMKRMLLDLKERIAQDPHGGAIAALYRHTLLALQNNPLMCALYTRDSRILGDYVRRQDIDRYTRRLLLSAESIRQMQAAGQLRSDLRPEVMAYLFGLLSLGFLSVNAVIPAPAAPPLEEVIDAMAGLVQSGLVVPGSEGGISHAAVQAMIDLMLEQYEHERSIP